MPVTSILAHRGSTSAGDPENSIAAFLEAKRLGADGVELDVRRSGDGALVVHHDAVVPGGRPLSETAVADLPPSVPLLGDAVAACNDMIVNVEVKNAPGEPGYDSSEGIALEAAELLGEAGDLERFIVSSFSVSSIEMVRRADPRLAVGWLLGLTADVPACLEEAAERGYQAIHPFVTVVDRRLVERGHERGLSVNVWTVNAPHDMGAMAALHVDALITDDVATAVAVVRGA